MVGAVAFRLRHPIRKWWRGSRRTMQVPGTLIGPVQNVTTQTARRPCAEIQPSDSSTERVHRDRRRTVA